MSKFRVGDKVKRVRGADDRIFNMFKGDIRTVKATRDDGIWKDWLVLEGSNDCWDPNNFELIEDKVMKKSDLKTGMRIKYRNGQIGIILADIECIALRDGFNTFNGIQEDLTYESSSLLDLGQRNDVWDVVEVYEGYTHNSCVLNLDELGKLLWKRETKTLEQIQLDKVMSQIKELQDQADKLQSLMKNK